MIESATEFIEECHKRGYADSTLQSHETTLELFSEWIEGRNHSAKETEPKDIEQFIEWLKDNWDRPHNEIRSTAIWSLNKYFKFLLYEGKEDDEYDKESEVDTPCEDVDIVGCIILEQGEDFLNRIRGIRADSTVENREYGLMQFSFWLDEEVGMEFEQLTPLDLENYAIFLKNKGYSDTTVKDRFAAASVLYEHHYEKTGLLDSNPAESVNLDDAGIVDYRDPTRKSSALNEDIYYVEPDEKEKMLENVPGPFLRNELLIRFIWQTGLRRDEVSNVRIEDIDWNDRLINIKGKGDKNRKVFYQPSLDDALNIWLERGYRNSSLYAEESPYLFLSERSPQLHPNQINQVVVTAAKNAGVQSEMYTDPNGQSRYEITAHSLRHGFAVRCLKNGMNIKTLADLMGHESLDTTKEYLKFTTEDLRVTYRKYGPGGTESE